MRRRTAGTVSTGDDRNGVATLRRFASSKGQRVDTATSSAALWLYSVWLFAMAPEEQP